MSLYWYADVLRKKSRVSYPDLLSRLGRRIHLKRDETITINSKRLSLPIFHAAEINLYRKTQLCERTGGNINVQHAVFDRKRRTRDEDRGTERCRWTGCPEREGGRGGGGKRGKSGNQRQQPIRGAAIASSSIFSSERRRTNKKEKKIEKRGNRGPVGTTAKRSAQTFRQ